MGSVTTKALKTENPKVFDYANKLRSDFMDMYLSSHCRFSINSTSGVYAISKIFKRPMVGVNLIPLHSYIYLNSNDIFIPKLLKSREEDRLLTFRESIGLDGSHITQQVDEGILTVIENTSDEIADLALEMDDRLKENYEETQEDQELQQTFWKSVESSSNKMPKGVRIGTKFLRKYQDLY